MVNSITSQNLFLADRQPERKTGQNTLDQDAFLKILMTQLRHQDPSKPMEDKEFIAQMANFSSLEQMTQMNRTLTEFIHMQVDSHFLSHSNLIGQNIQWEQVFPGLDGESTTKVNENTVNAIKFQNGKTRLVLDNGEVIDTLQVIYIGGTAKKENDELKQE